MSIAEILSEREVLSNDAVMFDIDDTLIDSRTGEPIKDVVNALNYCKDLNYKIIIITARPNTMESIIFTRLQLKNLNIYYDGLYFMPSHAKGDFKRYSTYKYFMSFGDMDTDLTDSLYWVKISR
jgi:FMN phosphatase YigB (HAD superfamily)